MKYIAAVSKSKNISTFFAIDLEKTIFQEYSDTVTMQSSHRKSIILFTKNKGVRTDLSTFSLPAPRVEYTLWNKKKRFSYANNLWKVHTHIEQPT